MDETSLCLVPRQPRGNVFAKSSVSRKASLASRRTCFTHVACVVDEPEIQLIVPQFIIMNERVCRASEFEKLRSALPANFTLLRKKSAWSNSDICSQYVVALRSALEPFVGTHCVCLLWDAAKIHASRKVLSTCRDAGLNVISIPPPTTSKLQVLDTHVFSKYKSQLAEELQCEQLRTNVPVPAIGQFFGCVVRAVGKVFERTTWARAFDDNGFGRRQNAVSRRVRAALGGGFPIASHDLSREDVKLCFPKRAHVHWDLLLPFPLIKVLTFLFHAPLVRLISFAQGEAHGDLGAGVWAGRLRPRAAPK